jgi:hypothetical protein
MPNTISEIVEATQALVGEVAGIGVQTYGEDVMMKHAIRAFNVLHAKYPWDEYRQWFQLTLDGTTGRVTSNNSFDYVREFGDFLTIQPTGTSHEIALLHNRENPFVLNGSGYPSRYTSVPVTDADWQAKRLQFYPLTSTGTLDICTRVYPAPVDQELEAGSIIHLDKDMVTFATAFQVLAFDDTNSNALDIVRNMLDIRYNDLTANRAAKPMAISGGSGIPTNWTER